MDKRLETVTFEASDLGWKPDYFMFRVNHKGLEYFFNNKLTGLQGELVGWRYLSKNLDELIIFND